MKNQKFRMVAPCYFAFFVSGAFVLLVGTILPYLIEEAGINYSTAGGFLSAFAIGNLLASFVNPAIAKFIGKKWTTVILTALIPISFYIITLIPPTLVIYIAFVTAGIGRGSVSIINNEVVNNSFNGKPAALNLLHMTFAVGAFVAPFVTMLFIGNGFNWRAIVYAIIVFSCISTLGYAWMSYSSVSEDNVKDETSENSEKYYRNPVFYISGFLLFLYLGLENCVNGWFVTYFKSIGIMSDSYAATLVSITWVMVMLGRLLTAKLSTKIDRFRLVMAYCIATCVFFILLIATKNLIVITVAIAGLGFFFAGIYPTSVASVGNVVRGSKTGMSMFLAIAALGGIITPKIVGVLADNYGMVSGILILAVNAVGMLILAIINVIRNSGKGKQ